MSRLSRLCTVLQGRRGQRLETLLWVEVLDQIMEEVPEVQVVLHSTQGDLSLDLVVHNLDLNLHFVDLLLLVDLLDQCLLCLEDRMDLHQFLADLPHLLLDRDNLLLEDDLPLHQHHLLMMRTMNLLMSMMLIQLLRTTLMISMMAITNFFATAALT